MFYVFLGAFIWNHPETTSIYYYSDMEFVINFTRSQFVSIFFYPKISRKLQPILLLFYPNFLLYKPLYPCFSILASFDKEIRPKRDNICKRKRIYDIQRMFRARSYPREVKFYTGNVRASVTNSMSALHCTELHCTALHCTALLCTVLYCTELHCTALHCTALHCIALHLTALHCIALQCTSLHCTSLHCAYCTSLQCTDTKGTLSDYFMYRFTHILTDLVYPWLS